MLISHASKVILKILQARFQRYMNWEFTDVQARFKKVRGTSFCWFKTHGIRSHRFMANEEETVEALTNFISLGSKITADGEIKWHLLLGRKDMTNLDSMLKKQRHHFANKGPSSQSYGFPVVMYKCETWTIKEAEHWRTDAFELWCWRKLLRVP